MRIVPLTEDKIALRPETFTHRLMKDPLIFHLTDNIQIAGRNVDVQANGADKNWIEFRQQLENPIAGQDSECLLLSGCAGAQVGNISPVHRLSHLLTLTGSG